MRTTRSCIRMALAALIAALALTLVPLMPGGATADATAVAAGWWAQFFSNTTLSGSPILTRADSAVNFDWGGGAPAAGVPADNFSARWTRTEWFDSGTYRFSARADDGFRLWVGDLLVIDAWHHQQGGWITRDLYLGQGSRQVRAEYYEHTGGALVMLSWERLTGGYGWQAEYFANRELSGSPAVLRTEAAVDFSWGLGSPDEAIPVDGFSARWTYSLGFSAGTYRFFTSTDDGVRLWVDGSLLVDAWYNQSLPNTRWGDIVLGNGLHEVKVEYYEDGGEAHAHAWWQRLDSVTSPAPAGWKGEYFTNHDLSGGPALIRDDAEIDFDWGTAPPVSWMADDGFSVRWTREIGFEPGHYRLSVRSDDGVRVWLNNGLVIDKWQVMDNELHYVDGIYLSGANQFKIEYFEQNGLARIRFWIEAAGGPTPPSPAAPPPSPAAVIIDDAGAGFVRGGSSTAWRTAAVGYGDQLTWTRNNDYLRTNYNWGRWTPTLAPGRHEVLVFVPDQYATTTGARYWIKHAGQYSVRTVDQSAYHAEWVSLGTYDFSGSGDEFVSLSDVTHESYLSRRIAFDAVQWVPR